MCIKEEWEWVEGTLIFFSIPLAVRIVEKTRDTFTEAYSIIHVKVSA